jgi:hypothetical protein
MNHNEIDLKKNKTAVKSEPKLAKEAKVEAKPTSQ